MNRAWALLEIKSIDKEQRVIEGIASTPTPDGGGHVMEPRGAQFKLPLPFLWFHNQRDPIGEVFAADVRADGIFIKARVSKVGTPGRLKTLVDEAWAAFTADPPLVRGLSIGWDDLASEPIKGTDLTRFTKWFWGELSAVTIPMNRETTILAVKELDQAASGPNLPGVSGLPIVKAKGKMTVQEQISSFENTRAAKVARMNAIMGDASTKGETLDQTATEEYDGLEREVKAIDDHLPRLRLLEKTNLVAATPITAKTPEQASEQRSGTPVVTVKSNLPKGTAFTRYALAKMIGAITMSDPVRVAESRKEWLEQTPEVLLALKAAVNPGTIAEPAWAAPLAVTRPMAEDFLELLRPKTLLGRINGLRKVPFNISMPVQTGGGTYRWVGEGAPKPVGNLQLTSATLGIAKAAGIIVFSQELAKLSSPNVETVVSNDMVKGMAQYLDQQFIDPTVAAVANVSPASITNGAVSIGSAGTSGANAETDFKGLVGSLIAVNQSLENVTLIMSETNALALSMARTTNGEPYFPNLTMNGGNIGGIPVLTSQAAGTTVAMIVPNEILFADDGGVDIDVSREASLEMDTAPTSPTAAATVMVSLWQLNLIGMKAERWINYKRARAAAVRYTTATYV